ncbi:MAG: hypothetical protein EA402_13860 [Planctomycetota bacterium]|nr:MAG: hypothetical protein EA402_13860 [Planctomycetota bacterium]
MSLNRHDRIDHEADLPYDDELTPESEQESENQGEKAAAVSAWGLSLALHAIVLLLLTFVVIAGRMIQDPVPVRPAMIIPPPPPPPEVQREVALQEVEVTIDVEVEVQSAVVSDLVVEIEELATEDTEVSEVAEARGREEAVSTSETGGSGAFMAIGAGGGSAGAFGNRSGSNRRQALSQFGGSRASEAAVDRALRWFVRHQSPNGMWSVVQHPLNCDLPGPRSEPGQAYTGPDGDAAMTAYAVLAFLGAGYDHRTPNRYRRTVANGLDWLVENQRPDGSFGRGRNYENGIAAMALAEAFAMTMDPRLREPAQRSIDVLLRNQNDQSNGYGGLGWDYTRPVARNDSSVTGWVVMALKSAEAGGLNIGTGMQGARHYFERAWLATNNRGQGITDPYSHRSGFPYVWNSDTDTIQRPDRTAIGLCIGVFLGKGQGDLMMETLANDVMVRAFDLREPDYQIHQWPVNTYYLYYNTLGIFQVGGERWQRWNAVARDMLIEAQRRGDDCLDGSWDWQNTRFHGHRAGRLLSTAYAALSLQVYYRYAPVAAR